MLFCVINNSILQIIKHIICNIELLFYVTNKNKCYLSPFL